MTVQITHQVVDASSNPVAGATVRARLRPDGAFEAAGGAEVISDIYDVSDASGNVTLDLNRNIDITPAGTYYEVTVEGPHGQNVWAIRVTAAATLFDSLIDPPTAGESAPLTSHLIDPTDAHDASAISFTPAGTIAATDVQAAIEEVATEVATGGGHTIKESGTPLTARAGLNFTTGLVATDDAVGDETEVAADVGTGAGQVAAGNHNHDAAYEAAGTVATHLADAVDAHDASAVSFVPAGTVAATDVQAAIAEVASDAAADLAAHTGDTIDAHDASAVSFVPAGTIAATDAQAAIEEVATDAASALSTHAAAADPHAGYVLESLFDANTLLKADADNTPSALVVGEQTLVGRITAGLITALSAAQVRTLLDVPLNGDAVLKSLFDANTVLAADVDNTPAALTVAASTMLGRKATGGIAALSVAEVLTLLGLTTEELQDLVGAMVTGNTESGGTLTYDDTNGKIDLSVTGGGGGAGALLAETQYAPVSNSTTTITTTLSDLDATNMAVTFTLAAQTNIYADIQCVLTSGTDDVHVALREGSTTVGVVVMCGRPSNRQLFRARIRIPNASAATHTYKLAAATSSSTGLISFGPGGVNFFPPVLIQVFQDL